MKEDLVVFAVCTLPNTSLTQVNNSVQHWFQQKSNNFRKNSKEDWDEVKMADELFCAPPIPA